MNIDPQLMNLVALLAGMATISERLVDAIKNIIPFLSPDGSPEQSLPTVRLSGPKARALSNDMRQGLVAVLAIICGIGTAYLARSAGVGLLQPPPHTANDCKVILYGCLAAGGSRLWNPILELLKAYKDAKKGNIPNLRK